MAVSWTWDLLAYISGSFVSIASDVMCHKAPITAMRGITGRSIDSRVASPGSLTCTLDNGESNSAGLLGYYSPDHANMRANFGRNTIVQLKITSGGNTRYLWRGYITDLQPTPGRYKDRESHLTATDFMQRMAEHRLDLIPVQEDKRSDQLVQTILSNMSVTPINDSIETDKFTLPFALSSEMDEKSTAMSAMQKVCQTVLGYIYIRGDISDGETFVFQREETRARQASAATLNNTMSELRTSRNVDELKNKVIGLTHPVRVDESADTLLYELDNEIPLDGGDTQVVTFKYKDPNNQAIRISATDVVTPLVADTHYRMSAYANGVANDMTSSLSITPTVGGNAVEAELENTGGQRGFINLINIFGKGIYYYNPVEHSVESGAGDRPITYDFFYLSDPYRAKGFLQALHYRASTELTHVDSVSFLADYDATLMGYAMTVDIGDRVTIVEAATGLSDDYTINKITYTIQTNGTLKVDWALEPADAHTYFTLNSSQLNGSHVLSPY